MGEAARQSAERYAWPRVADRVTEVYERAIEAPRPADSDGARSPTGPACGPPTAAPPARRSGCPRSTRAPARAGKRRPRRSPAASASASPASSASA